MSRRKPNRFEARRFVLGLAFVLAATALLGSGLVSAARTQESRPRRKLAPQATPTPVSPRTTQTVPSQSPPRPATSSVATPPPTPPPRATAEPTTTRMYP